MFCKFQVDQSPGQGPENWNSIDWAGSRHFDCTNKV